MNSFSDPLPSDSEKADLYWSERAKRESEARQKADTQLIPTLASVYRQNREQAQQVKEPGPYALKWQAGPPNAPEIAAHKARIINGEK